MQRGFWSRVWDGIKKAWYLALYPFAQKLFDWIFGDAVVTQIKYRAREMHLPGVILQLFEVFSRYPVRCSLVLMCLIVSISAVVATRTNPPPSKQWNDGPSQLPRGTNKEPQSLPTLQFVQDHRANVTSYMGSWIERSTGETAALLALFRNTPKTTGQQTPTANSVSAHLSFEDPRNPSKQVQHINFGTWIDEYTRRATFEPGQSKLLIIAMGGAKSAYVPDNERTLNPFKRRFRSGTVISLPAVRPLVRRAGEVEITLVDTSDTTVFQGRFSYCFMDEEETFLKPL